MNRTSTLCKMASLALTMLLCALPLMAQKNTRRPVGDRAAHRKAEPVKIMKVNGQEKYAYGVVGFDYTQYYLQNTFTRFPFTDGATFTKVTDLVDSEHDVTAGAYADGYYYAAVTQTDPESEAMVPVELVRYDIEGDELKSVGPLSGYTSHINDMAYDNSSKKMYAISIYSDGEVSALYTVDLNTAVSTPVGKLDRPFFTLACTYEGQLYGISYDGDLCKIDKDECTVEVVGPTGWKPNYYQSMEFDHTDGTLYWAANLIEGTGNDDCIATVDINTGAATKVATVGDLPQIAGLYIPFSASAPGTPAAVSNFTVVPGENGATKATLSWTYPTTTFDGLPLSSISSAKLFRDHKLIKTFTGVKPGEAAQYVDDLGNVKGAVHHYTMVVVNEVGDGAEAKDFKFVGHDIPAAVTDLKASTNDNIHVTLSWNQPEVGPQGGYVDMSSLSYTVTRSDGKVVAKNLKATTVTDEVTKALLYTYTVKAVNADGESEAVETEEHAYGPVKTLPAIFDFKAADADNSWTILNDNSKDSEAGWEWTETQNGNAMGHRPSGVAVSNDWLIGYYMPFEKDVTYILDFDYMSYGNNKVELLLTKDLDPEATFQQIGTLFAVETKKVKRYSIPFKAKESGTFNVALHAMSPVRADWLYLYHLTVRKAENVNLAAKELTGNVNPVQGEESVYTVKVANEGTDDVKGFSVKLKDQDGAELATKTFAETTIKSGEETDVQIAWKPATTTTTAIKAEVAPTGAADEWAEDDITDALMIGVRPPFTGKTVSVGLDAKLKAVTTPFAFAWQYAAAQNIYTADEIGVADDQSIVKVAWPYNAMEVTDEDAKDVPVRVYMANTDRTNNTDGWIAESDYTLVYDGTVNIAKQTAAELAITLSKPFTYKKGQNIAVLTVINAEKYSRVMFKAYDSKDQSKAAYEWYNYETPGWFDFTQSGHLDYLREKSSVTFFMTDAQASGISATTVANLAGTTYQVYDLAGRKVADGVFAADGSISTSQLQRGAYVVSFKANGKVQSMKVSINK